MSVTVDIPRLRELAEAARAPAYSVRERQLRARNRWQFEAACKPEVIIELLRLASRAVA